MKIFVAAILAALYLGILWGPTLLVARRLYWGGWLSIFRWLRIILPSQLVLTVALLVFADIAGLRNPAGLMALATVGVSALGAAIMTLSGFVAMPRN